MAARVVNIIDEERPDSTLEPPVAVLILAHDERHVRRRTLPLPDGSRILVDFAEPTVLQHGDRLVLEDGRHVRIEASPEDIFEVRGRDGTHLLELAWHIGNRHLAAEVHADCIRILSDPVIRTMLITLGARVTESVRPFVPLRGAYAATDGKAHHHHHEHH